MEHHVDLTGPLPDWNRIDAVVRAVDPAAMLDIDPQAQQLRIATAVNAIELVSLLNQAGYPVLRDQIRTQPSVCCGGCSG